MTKMLSDTVDRFFCDTNDLYLGSLGLVVTEFGYIDILKCLNNWFAT